MPAASMARQLTKILAPLTSRRKSMASWRVTALKLIWGSTRSRAAFAAASAGLSGLSSLKGWVAGAAKEREQKDRQASTIEMRRFIMELPVYVNSSAAAELLFSGVGEFFAGFD